jgi:peptidoglycan/LPS O-acetylase OafA/YrhL
MVHYPVIQVLNLWLELPGTPAGAALRYLLFLPASLAVALVFYFAVERRFLNAPAVPGRLDVPGRLSGAEG